MAGAVLSFGGFLGLGGRLFAVPWAALTLDIENKSQALRSAFWLGGVLEVRAVR